MAVACTSLHSSRISKLADPYSSDDTKEQSVPTAALYVWAAKLPDKVTSEDKPYLDREEGRENTCYRAMGDLAIDTSPDSSRIASAE